MTALKVSSRRQKDPFFSLQNGPLRMLEEWSEERKWERREEMGQRGRGNKGVSRNNEESVTGEREKVKWALSQLLRSRVHTWTLFFVLHSGYRVGRLDDLLGTRVHCIFSFALSPGHWHTCTLTQLLSSVTRLPYVSFFPCSSLYTREQFYSQLVRSFAAQAESVVSVLIEFSCDLLWTWVTESQKEEEKKSPPRSVKENVASSLIFIDHALNPY